MLIATTAHLTVSDLVAIGAPAEHDEDTARCFGCGDAAPDGVDADTARDRWGWVAYEEDGQLRCEDCAAGDGPSGFYDRAYWG